jgi:vacuolar-type H+-ATPase catalytic subunit A/Vma1
MGKTWRVSGPVVIAEDMTGSQVYEIVEIGNEGIIGEIIGLAGDKAIIQVHEGTEGRVSVRCASNRVDPDSGTGPRHRRINI